MIFICLSFIFFIVFIIKILIMCDLLPCISFEFFSAHSVNASNLPAVKLLVEAGAEVNFGGKNGRFPLYVAAKSSLTHSTEIWRLLLEHGARLDSRYINGTYSWAAHFLNACGYQTNDIMFLLDSIMRLSS